MKKILVILLLTLFLISCTQNSRAKSFGGTAEIDAPCGMMVGNITWKETQLWYSYIPMPEGYEPVTHTFQEVSSLGVIQGKYIIKESKCN